MKVAKLLASLAIWTNIVTATTIATAEAQPKSAIFVNNSSYVTAYPKNGNGNITPLAPSSDLIWPGGIARDAMGRIYITNTPTNTITIFPADAAGNVPPLVVIAGSKTRLAGPTGIALDAAQNIYVVNSLTGSINVYASPFIVGGINIVAPNFENPAPSAVIAGPKTKLASPSAIAVDTKGNIYVTNRTGGPLTVKPNRGPGSITVYSAGSTGNVAPISMIAGDATNLAFPENIALDANRNIYVLNEFGSSGSSIVVFPPDSDGDVPPSASIETRAGTELFGGFAVDGQQNIYATGYALESQILVNAVFVYAAGSSGEVAPTTMIVGADTGLNGAHAITLAGNGSLFVLNQSAVTVYPAGSSGDAPPIQAFNSSATGLGYATDIAIDSAANIYLTNTSSAFPNGSISVFSAGSYATTAPASVIGGPNTGLDFPSQIALDARNNISVLNGDGTVISYPAGSVGDIAPSATLDTTAKFYASGIARGPGDALYVANQATIFCKNGGRGPCYEVNPGSVDIYPSHANGNAKPTTVIAGYQTMLASPSAIAVSRSGNIFVANQGPMTCGQCFCFPRGKGSVTVYSAASGGNAKPESVIGGPHTRIGVPTGIAVDSEENIYVSMSTGYLGGVGGVGFCFGAPLVPDSAVAWDKQGGIFLLPGVFDFGSASPSVLMFKAGSNGDTPPTAIIRGPFTALGGSAIAIGPTGQ